MGPDLAKAILIYGFEHADVQIPLEPAIRSFEVIARSVLGLELGERVQATRKGLMHVTHAVVQIYAWELSAPT